MSFRKLLRQWFSSARRPLESKRRSSTARAKGRLQLEHLEDRLVPATFALTNSNTTLSLVLTNANTNVLISSTETTSNGINSGGGYDLVLMGGDTWTGSDGAGVIGSGALLTIPSSAINGFTSPISIVDSTASGDRVTFAGDSQYTFPNSFNINLSNPAAGPITFNGASNFGNNNLSASTTGAINFQGGASVPYQGAVTFDDASAPAPPSGQQELSISGSGPGWKQLGFAVGDSIAVAGLGAVVNGSPTIASINGNYLYVYTNQLFGPNITIGNVTVAANSAHVSAGVVTLSAGNSLTLQSTGVPYLGGVTIHTAPQHGQPFAGEQYITGPDWGGGVTPFGRYQAACASGWHERAIGVASKTNG